jgi:hypothetical protein
VRHPGALRGAHQGPRTRLARPRSRAPARPRLRARRRRSLLGGPPRRDGRPRPGSAGRPEPGSAAPMLVVHDQGPLHQYWSPGTRVERRSRGSGRGSARAGSRPRRRASRPTCARRARRRPSTPKTLRRGSGRRASSSSPARGGLRPAPSSRGRSMCHRPAPVRSIRASPYRRRRKSRGGSYQPLQQFRCGPDGDSERLPTVHACPRPLGRHVCQTRYQLILDRPNGLLSLARLLLVGPIRAALRAETLVRLRGLERPAAIGAVARDHDTPRGRRREPRTRPRSPSRGPAPARASGGSGGGSSVFRGAPREPRTRLLLVRLDDRRRCRSNRGARTTRCPNRRFLHSRLVSACSRNTTSPVSPSSWSKPGNAWSG